MMMAQHREEPWVGVGLRFYLDSLKKKITAASGLWDPKDHRAKGASRGRWHWQQRVWTGLWHQAGEQRT